jgi:hypothetical protein
MADSLKEQLAKVKVGNLTKKHKKWAVWPIEKKIEVVSQWLVLGNLKLVAASTGVDYEVLKQWRMKPWWKDLELEIRATQNIAMDNKLSKIIERSLEATYDRLENGEVVLNQKTGELTRRPVTMRDAARVATDMLSKQHILRTDEAEKPKESAQSVTEQLKTLAMEFAKWQIKETAKTEAIDVPFKEIDENLHEMQNPETSDGIQPEECDGKEAGPTTEM